MVIKALQRDTVLVTQRCPDLSPAVWSELRARLPLTERLRIETLQRAQDRRNSTAAWLLLHQLAGDRGATVHRAPSGRPGAKPPLDVSLSHSGDWIGVALCEAGRIGVDLEKLRPVSSSLVRRCLTVGELAWLHEVQPGTERSHRFFRLWTAKEAFLKATGVGLSMDPREISIDCSGEEPVLLGDSGGSWRFFAASPEAGVCVTVCVERRP